MFTNSNSGGKNIPNILSLGNNISLSAFTSSNSINFALGLDDTLRCKIVPPSFVISTGYSMFVTGDFLTPDNINSDVNEVYTGLSISSIKTTSFEYLSISK